MSSVPSIITTPRGPIEVDVQGTGKPILILHGSPGGADAAIAMARFLPKDKFKCICVSRPGYLHTPLHTDPRHHSIDDEAHLLAALLRSLSVPRVGILAWSGGGGAAYRLAVLYPDLIAGIVAVCAVSFRWVAPKVDVATWFMFGTKAGEKTVGFLTRHSPRQVIKGALEGEGSIRGKELEDLATAVMADEKQRELVLDIARTVSTAGKRKAGWENDARNFAAIGEGDGLELREVRCPVLLVHGDADTDAVIEYSRFAHERLRESKLIIMEGGTHLCFYADPGAERVQEESRQFLSGLN